MTKKAVVVASHFVFCPWMCTSVPPDVGPVDATYDLQETEAGTSLRLRWAAAGSATPDAATIARLQRDRRAALDRLANVALSPVARDGF